MLETVGTGDPRRELQEELVLTIRAERRLREHELTRRRVLLALTVALPIAAVVLALLGEPIVGGVFLGGGLASGAGAIPPREGR